MKINCNHCGAECDKAVGAVNRAAAIGAPLYCNLICAGLARRKPPKTKAQRVEEKRLYDERYRERNRELLKAKKAAWFQKSYDPVAAAEYRQGRMAQHVEYCRQPEYRAWKSQYDRRYHAKTEYGEFWEAALLALDIETEVTQRATRYEVYIANGTVNKTQGRKRSYARLIGTTYK